MHVLYLDPKPISQKALLRIIGGACNCTMVSTIDEARINLNKNRFDAFIVCAEEGIDELLLFIHDLRRVESPMRDGVVLLISAGLSADLAYRAWRAGVHESFAKPLQAAAFLERLRAQIAEPQVVPVEREGCTVECVSWTKGGLWYLYAPDLHRLVTAGSQDAAVAQMRELFEHYWYEFEHSRFGEARCTLKRLRLGFQAWHAEAHLDVADVGEVGRSGLATSEPSRRSRRSMPGD